MKMVNELDELDLKIIHELYLDGKKSDSTPWASFVYAGTDGLVTPAFESNQLSRSSLNYWTKRAYREFYLRPSYLWQRIKRTNSVGDLTVDDQGLIHTLVEY